jgi:GTP:adenosylcobinamide-phosphate guanylyltransferase
VLKEIDSGLKTFFNINTLMDLKSAEKALRDGRREKSGYAEKNSLLP